MPVNTPCKEYTEALTIWRKIRDVMQGEKRLKQQGTAELYLVKPSGFEKEPKLWELYLSLAEFFPATRRTVVGLKGAIFRRAPAVDLKGAWDDWAKAVTQDAQSLVTFSKVVTEEVLTVGRYGILVDFPRRKEGEKSSSSMPYLAGYCAEAIINWRTSTVVDPDTGAKKVSLSLVVLKEKTSKAKAGDEFTLESADQYRVLDIFEGKYRQRIFIETSDGKKSTIVQDGSDLFPEGSNGEPLAFIPFMMVGATNLTPDIDVSPIEDLVDVNLSHFKTSADLEWGAHLTACPTPWVTGWEAKGKKLGIGSGLAWTFSGELVKVGMLEYTGQGLGALERRLESKENKMSKLGAMILKTKMKQPETAEATRIEHSGEASVLALIAGNVSEALTQAAGWAEYWKTGKMGAGKIELNTEFYDQRLSPEELSKLVEAHQKGEISTRIYVYNLARGDMLPKDMTQEEAIIEIDESLNEPRLMPLARPLPLPGSDKEKPAPAKNGAPDPGSDKQKTTNANPPSGA